MDTERQQSEIEWPREQRSHVLRNTSLGMTALTVGLILIGTMVAASAPPDEWFAGMEWFMAGMLAGIGAICCWLATGIAALWHWWDNR